MVETKITPKNQTTIPGEIRRVLGVKSGDAVDWCTMREIVVVDSKRRMKDPVKFLTSQIKSKLDAVKLVKEAREDFK